MKPLNAFARVKEFAQKGRIKTEAEILEKWESLDCSAFHGEHIGYGTKINKRYYKYSHHS